MSSLKLLEIEFKCLENNVELNLQKLDLYKQQLDILLQESSETEVIQAELNEFTQIIEEIHKQLNSSNIHDKLNSTPELSSLDERLNQLTRSVTSKVSEYEIIRREVIDYLKHKSHQRNSPDGDADSYLKSKSDKDLNNSRLTNESVVIVQNYVELNTAEQKPQTKSNTKINSAEQGEMMNVVDEKMCTTVSQEPTVQLVENLIDGSVSEISSTPNSPIIDIQSPLPRQIDVPARVETLVDFSYNESVDWKTSVPMTSMTYQPDELVQPVRVSESATSGAVLDKTLSLNDSIIQNYLHGYLPTSVPEKRAELPAHVNLELTEEDVNEIVNLMNRKSTASTKETESVKLEAGPRCTEEQSLAGVDLAVEQAEKTSCRDDEVQQLFSEVDLGEKKTELQNFQLSLEGNRAVVTSTSDSIKTPVSTSEVDLKSKPNSEFSDKPPQSKDDTSTSSKMKATMLKAGGWGLLGGAVGTLIGGPIGMVAGAKLGVMAASAGAAAGSVIGGHLKSITKTDQVTEEVTEKTGKDDQTAICNSSDCSPTNKAAAITQPNSRKPENSTNLTQPNSEQPESSASSTHQNSGQRVGSRSFTQPDSEQPESATDDTENDKDKSLLSRALSWLE